MFSQVPQILVETSTRATSSKASVDLRQRREVQAMEMEGDPI